MTEESRIPDDVAVTTIVDDEILECLAALAIRFGLAIKRVARTGRIPGSYWGEPEAGLIGATLYLRHDTPVHSVLHELAHFVCMPSSRRRQLHTDAGGADIEEAAVCFLQTLLVSQLDNYPRQQLWRDMDAWGYSFRCGSARQWFATDAGDARDWLLEKRLIRPDGSVRFALRDG